MCYGTAVVIADNLALTAAHSVYSRQENCFAKYVSLIMKLHKY